MKAVHSLSALLTLTISPAAGQVGPPLVDHHQHLFSPAAAALVTPNPLPPGTTALQSIDADRVIGLLDSAGIRRALVLSVAYTWGNPSRHVENEYEQVKAENDWTAQQVGRYPDRLRAFCSFNPLRDYALDELNRCFANPLLRTGLKLHIGNSAVDYHNAQHREQLRRVFRAADDRHMAIVIHMRASISRNLPYGREEARIFFDSILPAAPHVPVQIAHLAGAGARAVRLGRGRRGQPGAARGVGRVSHVAADRSGVSHHRHQRRSLHAIGHTMRSIRLLACTPGC